MRRKFFREEKEKVRRNQINIVIAGLGPGVGTTFIGTSLAFYYAEKNYSVTYVQCYGGEKGRPLIYDEVAMNLRFIRREFYNIYDMIRDGNPLRGVRNLEEGVNWLIPADGERKREIPLSAIEVDRLFRSASDEICIFDVGSDTRYEDYCRDGDFLIVVCDPLPAKLIAGADKFAFYKRIELSGIKTCWLANFYNEGVNSREICKFLKTNRFIRVPEFPRKYIYASQFRCKFPWDNEEIKLNISEIFTKVSQEFSL